MSCLQPNSREHHDGQVPSPSGHNRLVRRSQPDSADRHWTRNKPLLPARYVDHLSRDEVTIAEVLKAAGYRTFFAGKWHLGGKGYWPEDHGFDINCGGYQAGAPSSYFSPYKNPKLSDGPKGEHLDDRLATESIKFLEQVGPQPFLLYLSFYSVHIPLQAKPELIAKYEAKRTAVQIDVPLFKPEGDRSVRQVQEHVVYSAMIESMDHAVGQVLDALDRLGLAESTAVFFMSDNGGLSTAEGSPTSNLPLRAGKGWLYEGGIREPMIVKWPGVVKPGSTCGVPVISTDFYPTMLEMANLPPKPDQHVDGASLVPLLRQTGTISRPALYWHYPHYSNQGGRPGSAVRCGDWKLIEFFEDGRLELYDMQTDLGETRNLAGQYRAKTAELHRMLQDWRKSVGARLPTPNPNREAGQASLEKTAALAADD